MTTLKTIQYGIVKHCNLNCQGCGTFSGIKKEEFIDISVFEKDISRMKEIFENIENIDLYGGEPLLHPFIHNFIEVARKYFEKSKIFVITNGLLLQKMNDTFWNSVRNNQAIVRVSFYPTIKNKKTLIKKYLGLHELLKEKKVLYEIRVTKEFGKTLILKKHSNPKLAIKSCRSLGSYCPNLENGRLYHCSLMANAKLFNTFFNQNIEVYNGLNIHNTKLTGEQIIKLLDVPTIVCSYCYYKCQTYDWKNIKKTDINMNNYVLNDDEYQRLKKEFEEEYKKLS